MATSPLVSIGAPVLSFFQAQQAKQQQDAANAIAAAQRTQVQSNSDRAYNLDVTQNADTNTRAANALKVQQANDAQIRADAEKKQNDTIYVHILDRVNGLGGYKAEDQPVMGAQILNDYHSMGLDKIKDANGNSLYAPPTIPGAQNGTKTIVDPASVNQFDIDAPITNKEVPTFNPTLPPSLAEQYKGQSAQTAAQTAQSKLTDPAAFQKYIGTLPQAQQRQGVDMWNKSHGTHFDMPGMPNGNPAVNGGYVPYYTPSADVQGRLDAQTENSRYKDAMVKIEGTHYQNEADHQAAVLKETGRHNAAMEQVAGQNANTSQYRAEHPSPGTKGATGSLTENEQANIASKITKLWTPPKAVYNQITQAWEQPKPLALTTGKAENIRLHAILGQNPDGSPMTQAQMPPVSTSANPTVAPLISQANTTALQMVGKVMGENGCARTVCAIAKQVGLPIPNTESAGDMEKQMKNYGYQKVPITQAQVVFSNGQGPSGRHVEWHIGNGVTIGDPGKASNYKVSNGKLPTNDPSATGWAYTGKPTTPAPVTTPHYSTFQPRGNGGKFNGPPSALQATTSDIAAELAKRRARNH